jgi:hypothetical protein
MRLKKYIYRNIVTNFPCSRFLRQPHSWAPFHNSERAIRKILTAVKTHPYFLDLLHDFGHPDGGVECNLSGDYDSHVEMTLNEDGASGPSFG